VLLPLKGQELTQPDVILKHSFYSEILAARSFPREEFSLDPQVKFSGDEDPRSLWNIPTQ
jgi:hypothetical protein